jgi:hypothetical protein
MNRKTERQIKEFIHSLYSADTVKFYEITNKCVRFNVEQSYSYVDYDFELLLKISKFFNPY